MKVYLYSDFQEHWPEGPSVGPPVMPKAKIIGLVLAENKNQAARQIEERLGSGAIKGGSIIRVDTKNPYVYLWKVK